MKSKHRILSLIMAVVLLMTFCVPASAMDFDDLATVVEAGNPTATPEPDSPPPDPYTPAPEDNGSSEPEQDTSAPEPDTAGLEASAPETASTSTSDDSEEKEESDPLEDTPVATAGTLPLGASGEYGLIPDGFMTPITTTSGSGVSTFSTAVLHMATDNFISYRHPFGTGTVFYPAYIFSVNGQASYCIEPARWNQVDGTVVTGSQTYSGLSQAKQIKIAQAIACNTSGVSNHAMYVATQVVIWQIAVGESFGSGTIYTDIIARNSALLKSAYDNIVAKLNSFDEIPSFMSADQNNPTVHTMTDDGGSWSIDLTNTNSNANLSDYKFTSKAALTFNVSGNTLTVSSGSEPGPDSFATGNTGDGGSGLVFWLSGRQGQAQPAGGVPSAGYMAFSADADIPVDPEVPDAEEPGVGYLSIYKYDGETNLPLGGAIFRIEAEGYQNDAFEVPYGGKTAVIPIPAGFDQVDVTVTEVSAPYQYVMDSTPKTVTVTKHETVNIAEVSFANYPQACSLTIYKYEHGNHGVALSGAKFRIRYADPNVSAQVWTLTTDSSGTIKIDLPAAGTLIIEELEAPNGYVIGHISSWDVTVAKGEHKTIDISNDKKSQLIVTKKDAQTGQNLAGAVFRATLLRSHTPPYESGVIYTQTSGADGRAIFSGLIPGEYRVEEQSPPQYYLPTSKVETVNIYDANTETVSLTFSNEPWTGLTIKKVDATDGKGLQGAVFKLYEGTAVETTKFLGDFQTNENGLVVIQNLESDKYYTIREAQPPFGYFLDADHDVQTVLIKPEALDENLNVIFRNMPKPKLQITKIDEFTGNRLPGAVFRVAKRDSAEYVEVTTGADGTVLLENMDEEWYQVTEIRSPSGYILDSTAHDIELIAGETAKLVVNNRKNPTLIIEKIDEKSGLRLAGAVFRVAPKDGGEYQDVTTNSGGTAVVENLTGEWYTVTEIRSPSGFLLDETPHSVQLQPGKTTTLKINNLKKPSLTIKKVDEQTGAGLAGAIFRITKDGAQEYQDVTTGVGGVVTIKDMDIGWVTITEQKAPTGYILDTTPHYIQLNAGEDAEIIIKNRHKPSLKIIKLDSMTKQPIQYVTFDIAVKNGAPVGSYTTNADGEIYLEDIDPNTYVITERPFDGYIALTSEKEVIVEWGKLTTVEFLNQPKNPLLIKKIDLKTGEPLAGAVFTVTKINGEMVGEFTTGRNGFITVTGLLPGFFTVRETKSPQGYILDSTPKIVELKLNQPAEVTFENKPLNGIQILKIDAQTREPLEGVKFVVREKGGRVIGEYTTDANGLIDVQGLQPGWFQVYESAALPGYLLDSNVRDVEFTWNGHVLLEFTNTKLSGLQVRKLDSVTKEPLQGVKFRLTKMDGTYVGDYVTNAGGYFAVANLEPDWYTAYETATIAGYVLDATPQNVQIKKGALAVLDFENKPLSGLQIKKTDAVTGLPLSGVEFKVTELDGRTIGNYSTDSTGLIFIPDLKAGWYIVSETKAGTGYKPDTAPRNVEVKTGQLNIVEYKNQPYPQLIIRKVDRDTLKPLEGVRFRLLDRYQREIGIFKTNSLGQIVLTGMDAGSYYCQEVEALAGYVLDSTVREIALQWGKTTTVEVKNTPMATLRIKKIDAVTAKPVPNVTFMLYDWKNNILGEFVTDNNGIIALTKGIEAGKYKLKETKAASGYVLDDQPRTIEVKSGESTEVVIENQPMRGKIQIVKKAAAENPVTKDKSGAALLGAMFEVYDKNLNIVDTITTDKNGVATTTDLPLGVYGVKETKAPDFYFTEGNVFYGELKVHGDLVRFEVLNNPADISVTVEKRGNDEVIAGDEMRYDFSEISNTSNISLSDFYWHDKLPAEAVRIKTIHTGTWNESLTYSVVYKTNLKSGYKTLAANLTSKQNHTLDVSPAALKLAAGEYVTDIRFDFGTVKAGFREDEAPSFVVTTFPTLPDGHRIVNHTDVSGTTGGKKVTAEDLWVTVALGKPKGCLPRTGY